MSTPREGHVSQLRAQLPGYLLWAELRGNGWHVVDDQGKALSGPHRSQKSALWHAEQMTDTSGT